MEANRVNGRPSRLGPSYHDQFAGAYAVIGILAAMLEGPASAEGSERQVEVGLYETGLHVASRDLVGVQLKTHLFGRPEREPHGEFSMPGYGAYLTSDERWIYLLMLNDAHWRKFCEALVLPQATDDSLATLRQRKKVREAVEEIVRAAVRKHSFDDIAARLKAIGVGCTEVLPLERVLDAAQAHQPGKLRDVDYRGLPFEVPEFPRMSGHAARDTLPPPELGEHTVEVLKAAGLSAGDCATLVASGAIGVREDGAFAWAPVRQPA
jgi:crotonobetainyl-CoA:carnitine CoA-transferase CaiB-like acyl-CoA transferase